jgi:hypothetical protein
MQMEELNAVGAQVSDQQRFVKPPFMYKVDASYSWRGRLSLTGK